MKTVHSIAMRTSLAVHMALYVSPTLASSAFQALEKMPSPSSFSHTRTRVIRSPSAATPR
jgi:hypothetical protein